MLAPLSCFKGVHAIRTLKGGLWFGRQSVGPVPSDGQTLRTRSGVCVVTYRCAWASFGHCVNLGM